MKYGILLFLLASGLYAQSERMAIDTARIDPLGGDVFCITVKGDAPTPGWQVKIVPHAFDESSVNWEMEVTGVSPGGMVIQVITPYTCSLETPIPRNTKNLTLVGKNKRIVLEVPRQTFEPKQSPMNIESAAIERLANNAFRITVSGQAPTPGWKIKIAPDKYAQVPENWEMVVLGTPPKGMVIQVISPYTYSQQIELDRKTEKITLTGSNTRRVLDVPWPKLEIPKQSHAPLAMLLASDKSETIKVMPGNLFIALVSVPSGFLLPEKTETSEYFDCLGFFSYVEALGSVNFGYVCRVKSNAQPGIFHVAVTGENLQGKPVRYRVKIDMEQAKNPPYDWIFVLQGKNVEAGVLEKVREAVKKKLLGRTHYKEIKAEDFADNLLKLSGQKLIQVKLTYSYEVYDFALLFSKIKIDGDKVVLAPLEGTPDLRMPNVNSIEKLLGLMDSIRKEIGELK